MSLNTNALQKLYVAYYGRPADPIGLAYWDKALTAGTVTLADVSKFFGSTTEYTTTYAGMSNSAIINKVYQNLFGHDADTGGLFYWTDLLNSGKVTIDVIVKAVSEGALTTDKVAFDSKVAAATTFTNETDTTQEVLAYSGTAANELAKKFIASVTDAATLAAATTPANIAAVQLNILAQSDPEAYGTVMTAQAAAALTPLAAQAATDAAAAAAAAAATAAAIASATTAAQVTAAQALAVAEAAAVKTAAASAAAASAAAAKYVANAATTVKTTTDDAAAAAAAATAKAAVDAAAAAALAATAHAADATATGNVVIAAGTNSTSVAASASAAATAATQATAAKAAIAGVVDSATATAANTAATLEVTQAAAAKAAADLALKAANDYVTAASKTATLTDDAAAAAAVTAATTAQSNAQAAVTAANADVTAAASAASAAVTSNNAQAAAATATTSATTAAAAATTASATLTAALNAQAAAVTKEAATDAVALAVVSDAAKVASDAAAATLVTAKADAAQALLDYNAALQSGDPAAVNNANGIRLIKDSVAASAQADATAKLAAYTTAKAATDGAVADDAALVTANAAVVKALADATSATTAATAAAATATTATAAFTTAAQGTVATSDDATAATAAAAAAKAVADAAAAQKVVDAAVAVNNDAAATAVVKASAALYAASVTQAQTDAQAASDAKAAAAAAYAAGVDLQTATAASAAATLEQTAAATAAASALAQTKAAAQYAADAAKTVTTADDAAAALAVKAAADATTAAAAAGKAAAADASAAAALVANFTPNALTPGLDKLTANVFIASETYFNVDGKGPTLNAGDVLTGVTGRTDNTLIINDLTPAGAAANGNGNIPAGVQLVNIQNVILNTSNNTSGGTGFSTVGYADVRSLTATTNGGAADLIVAKNGANGTAIVVSHNAFGGDTTIVGGTSVSASTSGGNLTIGAPASIGVPRVPLATEIATGAITATQNSSSTGVVKVYGGTTVNVQVASSSNTGTIDIGNTAINTGATTSGKIANATGAITVTTAGTGAVTAFGGTDVTITDTALKGAGIIQVGDFNRTDASNQPTGNVTIKETATNAYNGLAGSANNNVVGGAIGVFGGKAVSITTNAANSISIGNLLATNEASVNPTGAITIVNTGIVGNGASDKGAIKISGGTDVSVTTTGADVLIGRVATANNVLAQVSNPTGNITVNETGNASGFVRSIAVDGGKNVTITAKGQGVLVGGSVSSAPTGAVVVNQSSIFTGNGNYLNGNTNNGNVTINGGTTVNVTTTGGSVVVGSVIGGVNTVPSGAVTINRTASGPTSDTTTVQGGAAVNITTTKTSGAITVGANAAVLTGGITLKDANLAPTGDITISNLSTFSSTNATTGVVTTTTSYGTGNVNVTSNGAQTVTIKAATILAITDIQSTLVTSGANVGKAVGTSTLKTVTLEGTAGFSTAILSAGTPTTIQSDALTSLNISKNTLFSDFVITNNTAAHDLTITQAANAGTVRVVDAKAGTVTLTDSGAAVANTTNTIQLEATKATAVTINNALATTVRLGAVATDIAKVTLKGAGNVTFNAGTLNAEAFGKVGGNLAKALVIDASAATGNITAAFSAITTADTTQQYLGGSGVDTVTIDSNTSSGAVSWGNLVKIDGGAGTSDVLVANYVSAVTDSALGNSAAIKNFEILRLGTLASSAGLAAYDATGFTEVQVGTVAGTVNISNAAAGAALTLTGNTADNAVNFAGANVTGTANTLTVNLTGTTAIIAPAAGAGTGTGVITANGYEALTINASAGAASVTTKTLADNLIANTSVVTLNDASSTGNATLAITGTRGLTLNSNAGYTSINASTNTGLNIDVTGAKVSNTGVTFTGGASKLVAAGSNDAGNFKTLVSISGSNLANTNTVTVNVNGSTYTYTADATPANQSPAAAATALAAAINANAGAGIAAGATVGLVTRSATGGASPADFVATASGGNLVLTATAAYELTSKTNVGTTAAAATSLGGQELITLASASAINNAGNIVLTFANGGSAITVPVNAADSISVIATKIAAAITLAGAVDKPGVASATVSPDGNSVLITVQAGQTAQVGITATGGLTYVGGGVTATDSYNMATVSNLFATGAGGGDYAVGLGGAWNNVAHKYSSGSETIALDLSTAKTDTLKLNDGVVVTDNGSNKGGVTKFIVGSQAASDAVSFTTGKTIVANATVNVVNTVTNAANMAKVLDASGALNTALANLTYTISNGVITFGATGGNSLSQFTVAQLINAAQIIVSSSTTGGANQVAAFSFNGRSYVVASDAGNTLNTANGTTGDSLSTIVELKDVASVKGFGSTFGDSTIVANNVTNLGKAAVTTLTALNTVDNAGFAIATLAATNGTVAANTNVTKFTNLAASAQLAVNSNGGAGPSLGLVEVTQVGASGLNSLTVSGSANFTTLDRLTTSGDALLNFVELTNNIGLTVSDLVDATNTVNTITVGAGGNAVSSVSLAKFTGTALTTVDSSAFGGVFNFGAVATPDAHNGVTFKLAAGATSNIFANGAADVFTQTAGTGTVNLTAGGAGDTITLSNGANTIVASGANDTISVGIGTNTITALGANDTITIANNAATTTVTVGSNATVTVGANDIVKVFNAVTGAATTGTVALTTIKFGAAGSLAADKIDFTGNANVTTHSTLGADFGHSQVNVASAASLNDALNMAANKTLLQQIQGADASGIVLAQNSEVFDWFQYNGDTYVVAMVNNTGAAVVQNGLDANDIVVKLTGLVDLSGATHAAGVINLAAVI